MKGYRVMVKMKAGEDDYIDLEYNGIKFINRSNALMCLEEAKRAIEEDNLIMDAYIEEVYINGEE